VAEIRVQNFSTVPMRFSRLEATITIGGAEATRLDLDPGISVGPGSIELVKHVFTPSAGAKRTAPHRIAPQASPKSREMHRPRRSAKTLLPRLFTAPGPLRPARRARR
jgi:hypothetical protein